MDMPDEMTTLSQVMEKLRLKNIETEYQWTKDGFTLGNGRFYQPADLMIVKVFRFEGMSNPSDNAVLYVIEANDGATGYSIDAYGVYSDHDDEEGYNNFMRQIPEQNREGQLEFQL